MHAERQHSCLADRLLPTRGLGCGRGSSLPLISEACHVGTVAERYGYALHCLHCCYSDDREQSAVVPACECFTAYDNIYCASV